MKLSLFVIVKDNPDGLRRVMESAARFFDEVVIVDTESTDEGKTVEVAKQYTDKVFTFKRPDDFPWVEDFAAVRNFAMSKCTGDFIVWLDSDDTAVGFSKLREIIERVCVKEEKKADCIFLRYDYAFDEWGNCITTQFRERVLRQGTYDWKSPLHEVAIPRRQHFAAKMAGDAPYVVHEGCVVGDAIDKRRTERNLAIIERFEAAGNELETRLKLYKGNALLGCGKIKEAIPFYLEYIEESGFAEEVYIARCILAQCHRDIGELTEAIAACQDAVFESPDKPTAYALAAEIFLRTGKYDVAYHFAKTATECKSDTSHVAFNPALKLAIPAAVLQVCCLYMNKFEESAEWGRKAAMFMRTDPQVLGLLNQANKVINDKKLYEAYMLVRKEIDREGQAPKSALIRKAVPTIIRDLGVLAKEMLPPRRPGQDSIAFFCGNAVEPWGPMSVFQGIGGSEEAVINMAYEFRDLGWHVEVFGLPPADIDGAYEGVHWLPYWAYDEENPPDVFIAWRAHEFLRLGRNAKFRGLWLHDRVNIPMPDDCIELADKIFVLSKYHRDNPGLEGVPEEKIFYTTNGLNEMFLADPGDNEAHRVIFPNSPDRGLDLLLRVWPRIKKEVPDAELDIYYGFTKNYEVMEKNNPELAKLRQEITAMLDQPGVSMHGMVGHKQLAAALARAGVWAYPTMWPETSCITAMKVLAMGCYPVTSGFGVLPETTGGHDFGPVDTEDLIYYNEDRIEKFVRCVIDAMKRGEKTACKAERLQLAEWARGKYMWSGVAEKWSSLFLSQMLPV